MKTDQMKIILENMEALAASELYQVKVPGRDMTAPVTPLGEGEGETDQISETVGKTQMNMLVDAMIYSPRMERIMGRYGLDDFAIEGLRPYLIPALISFFSSLGIGTAVMTGAKAQARDMVKAI